MSVISGLIDKLRKSEQEWNQSNMFELAHMCHEAADTIWELRDDLQRANAENARLRSELDSVGTAAYLYGRSDLKAENAKLRELLDYVTPIAWYAASERERDRMRELGIEADV
jgi:cell shape-determining protein MreC